MAYILCGFSDFSGCNTIVSLILILATVMFIAVVQPYKDNRMNKVDIALLAVVVLSTALFSSVSESRASTVNSIVLTCVLVLLSIPQIVFYPFLVFSAVEEYTESVYLIVWIQGISSVCLK